MWKERFPARRPETNQQINKKINFGTDFA